MYNVYIQINHLDHNIDEENDDNSLINNDIQEKNSDISSEDIDHR